ncbi:hypothetical protein SAMN02745121_02582 [Nannocystis exedens]|uniref:Uncharacterized protein n=1 Tax=Nannocystis exedens TaxID=54 RepID=A0A1I1WWW3_9BACT|nr:hypothetical protein [Nannocystis exedens]PCC70951.1 hypothetical protein NAEX_04017 [Nannocystis exedens]SFD99542.1 hypothetical protein SAMN02745121_02582 [Nannocystis exedens]
MATEEWIQESLARLESLEEERKKHEDALETASDPATLRMHTQAVERLEVKIRALYAELEAVAAQDGGDDADADDVDDAAPEPEPVRAAPAAAPFTPPAAAPFSSPPAAAPFSSAPVSPFGDVPASAPFASSPADAPAFASSPAASFDAGDDVESSGSGSKIGLIIGLVLVLGGAGAYFAFGRKPAEEAPPPAAPTEVKVIKSGEVPPDTQGPRAAKGGDIDATHGAQIKETDRRTGGGGGGGGSSSSPPSSTEPKKKKEDKATKIESTDDPLAGIR